MTVNKINVDSLSLVAEGPIRVSGFSISYTLYIRAYDVRLQVIRRTTGSNSIDIVILGFPGPDQLSLPSLRDR